MLRGAGRRFWQLLFKFLSGTNNQRCATLLKQTPPRWDYADASPVSQAGSVSRCANGKVGHGLDQLRFANPNANMSVMAH